MKAIRYISLVLALGSLSCQPGNEPAAQDPAVALLAQPAHFPAQPVVSYNPTTLEGVLLGRKLFFDPMLSGNNRVSCATCHHPDKAFADGVALSTQGLSGRSLPRNSPALINLAWETGGFFWDGGATNLESQIIGPLSHPDEMGQNVATLADELATNGEYVRRFRAAFPPGNETGISTQNVLKALAQYMRTLTSANAPYDQFVLSRGTQSVLEKHGMAVFDAKCASCHTRQTNLFTDSGFHNNGLDDTYPVDDERIAMGRFRITEKPEDLGKFKTPTLRNLAYTAPYMHDGRLRTLDQVLDHYASGIKPSATLDPALRTMRLTTDERTALLAFLNTLNDLSFTQNPLFKP